MRNGDLDPGWVETIRDRLSAWFATEKRDLPWRADRDPYRILVSETMLVQTTVAAVAPFFERFVREFPGFAALADAEEDRVVKAWEGLGYYRRARHLHAAAKQVVDLHGGRMPEDPAAVRALPGVGRYMAGAILSQAFDLPEPILEANSQRVLARLLAWPEDLAAASTKARLWEAAARLVPDKGAGEFNQAMMELGALVCSPKSPRCLFCPISACCEARRLGVQDQVPKTSPRRPPLEVVEACAVVVEGGRVLMVRRSPPGLWAGFWEFPTIHRDGADPAGRSFGTPVELADGVERITGIQTAVGGLIQSLTFSVTKHRVRLDAYAASLRSGDSPPKAGRGFAEAAWVEPARLDELTLSAAGRRLARAIQTAPGAWGLVP